MLTLLQTTHTSSEDIAVAGKDFSVLRNKVWREVVCIYERKSEDVHLNEMKKAVMRQIRIRNNERKQKQKNKGTRKKKDQRIGRKDSGGARIIAEKLKRESKVEK